MGRAGPSGDLEGDDLFQVFPPWLIGDNLLPVSLRTVSLLLCVFLNQNFPFYKDTSYVGVGPTFIGSS